MQVLTIGSITVDILVTGLPAGLVVGDKQEVEHIDSYPGGGAVNAAAMFRRLGANVKVLGAVGNDMQAQGLRQSLLDAEIDGSLLQTIAHERTGTAVVLVDGQGKATVFAQRGANRYLKTEEALSALQQADVLYAPPLSHEATHQLLGSLRQINRQHAPKLVLNPSASLVRQRHADLLDLLPWVSVLCLNCVEAQMLAGVAATQVRPELSLDEAIGLASQLQVYPEQAVLLTLGAQGALLWVAGKAYYQAAGQANLVSTLGAGDCFSSTFTYYWYQGAGPEAALWQASQSAAQILGLHSANHLGHLRLACD